MKKKNEEENDLVEAKKVIKSQKTSLFVFWLRKILEFLLNQNR